MSGTRPLWRQGFDRAERIVGTRLEDLVSTRTFSDVLVLAFRGQNALYGLFERQTRTVLHFWNMPARTDVSKLRRQVTALAAELEQLSAQLEHDRTAQLEHDRTAQLERDRTGD